MATSMILREQVEQGDGTAEILIEVEPGPPLPARQAYGPLRGDEQVSQQAFSKGMHLIRACAGQVTQTMDALAASARPDEAELQFGIKFSGEAGAFIAKTGVEAQVQVTLRWTRGRSP